MTESTCSEQSNLKRRRGAVLLLGNNQACPMKHAARIGDTIGRLTIVSEVEPDSEGKPQMLCRCSCGATIKARRYNLRRGNTTSCGCVRRNRLEEDRLRITDRKAYLRLIWERYGVLYLPADEKEIRASIRAGLSASWTGLRKSRGDQ
jgi:hypothetical protein